MQFSRSGSAAGKAACTVLLSAALAACGSDGGGGGGANQSGNVSGSAVKGPMANAVVSIYQFSSGASKFQGTLLDTGSTSSQAEIQGLQIPGDHSGVIIFEVTADDDTIDLASGAAPAVTVFRTVLADTATASANPIYPSPLTTLAYDLAVLKADSNTGGFSGNNDGTTTEAEFLQGFSVAAAKVASSLGFGIPSNLDLNSTPPMVTAATTTTESLSQAASYRTAIEAVSAILLNIRAAAQASNANSPETTDSLLSALAADLSDGEIDGQADGQAISAFSDVADIVSQINVDPATLTIPGTNILVADVESILVSEKQGTGVSTDSSDLEDGTASATPVPAETTSDLDDDGVADGVDNCPNTANQGQADFDEDGVGNACDSDDDNDGVADSQDAFPLNAAEDTDSDQDGVGDNGDNCPAVANANQADQDQDGVGNACDVDDDNDGVDDEIDAFPLDASETIDTDSDGIGNNADTDDDGDGVNDDADAFPLDSTESVDADGDGVGDNSDAFPDNGDETVDTDSDGVGDNSDNCPSIANATQTDTDGDGIGDACDGDSPDAVWDSFNWNGANWQ
tara:strand:+ start:2278 stop:3990 length:1713 start_codon:yes stop_codon:yes gene_type:complete